jgi:hypothetical protein
MITSARPGTKPLSAAGALSASGFTEQGSALGIAMGRIRLRHRNGQPKSWVIVVAAIGIIAACAVAIGILSAAWSSDPAHGETMIETRTPVPFAQATRCPIPLPTQAEAIQYKVWTCGGGLDEYAVFRAPRDVCVAHAATVFAAWHKECDRRSATQPPASIPASGPALAMIATSQPSPAFLPPKSGPAPTCPEWFDPESITNGLASASHASHTPDIWIDLDRGIFYYHMQD